MAADSATHTLPIEIQIENKDLALRPAMVVEVVLSTGTSTDLLTLPMNAVVRDGALRTLSFVVVSEAAELSAQSRRVSLGRLIGDRVEIKSGLRAGDRVIVQGQHFLRDGDRVRIAKTFAVPASAEASP
jgi:multidrug efflux pump subunit AcrA (membrane-fusion protein)